MSPIANQPESAAEALKDLGFTQLEALVYLHLLRAGPETAYATAKSVGKPVANTYKAVESLERRGVVEVRAGEPRLVRASAPDDVLARLRQGFERRTDAARDALEQVEPAESDDAVYHLASAAQVVERARAIIASARACIAIDALPRLATTLAEDLAAAAARGVAVVALVYEPIELPGCEVILHDKGELVVRLLGGEHLLLSGDAERALLALLDPPSPSPATLAGDHAWTWPEDGGVRQAIHTESSFVAWHLHDNLHHQLYTYAVEESLADEPQLRDRLRAVYRSRIAGVAPIATPGWRTLLERHGTAEGLRLTDEWLRKREGTEVSS